MSSSIVVKMIAKQQQQHHHQQPGNLQKRVARMSTRRIFTPAFKLKVLHSYRNDIDCRGNQRATARKYKIHRRQIQKWLQVEENLINSCRNSNSTGSSVSHACDSTSDSSSLVSTPAASPQKDSVLNNNAATPASPALNLSGPARLHGDELVAVQQQPPPPRQPPPSAAAAAAAQALAAAAAQQRQTANYRFHHQLGVPAVVVPNNTNSTARGYPTAVVQPQYQYSEYSLLYPQPLASAYHRHQAQTQFDLHHHRGAFQPTVFSAAERKIVESAALSPASTISSLMSPRSLHTEDHFDSLHHHQSQQQHFAAATEIKTERASSPDSAAAMTPPGPYLYHRTPTVFKKEKLEDEYHHQGTTEYRRASLSNSSSGVSELSCSPAPSHLSGCPSPMPSSGGSDSEMDISPAGGSQHARIRRSYSLRFKLDVLDAFHRDSILQGNQRATARNFGINRRQVQKWLKQESELRGVIEMCASSDSRQRLGPVTDTTENPVDLRTSPPYETALTPPYSTPGCALSCCQDSSPANSYYCYSPMEVDSTDHISAKSTNCSQPCCYTQGIKKDLMQRVVLEAKQEQQEQETPLCLVKPKDAPTAPAKSMMSGQVEEPVSSSVPSPPAAPSSNTQGAILFKPYLDNVISKPTAPPTSNNNSQDTRDLNENRVPPTSWIGQHQQTGSLYLEQQYSQVKSAFVRYPSGHFNS